MRRMISALSLMLSAIVMITGCASKYELPSSEDPKCFTIQPKDMDGNGIIDDKDIQMLEEKVKACQLARQAGADFVKTSTGFSSSGATTEDVSLMRQTVGPSMGVKASGGIKTLDDAKRMIAAGASRIGVSASVQIVQQALSS